MIRSAAALTLALTGGAAAQDQPIPRCDALGDAGLTDCALVSQPLVLAFLYQPAGEGAVLTVTQTDAVDGATVVSAPIAVKTTALPPSLHDLNGDGVDEVFIPLARAGDTVEFEIWRLGPIGFFVPAGVIAAPSPGALVPQDGLTFLVTQTPDSTAVRSAYLFDEAGLTLVYAVEMDFETDRCTLVTGMAGLNQALVLAECEAQLSGRNLQEDSQ